MASIGDLYRLQEADSALETARAALEEVQSGLGESEELIEAGRTVEERKEALRAAEKIFKEQEFEADELGRKIQGPEGRLYEGKVSNPKELEDLQQEVDSLKRRRADLDDKALEAMEALDEAQRLRDEAQAQLETLSATVGAEQEALRGRQASLQDELRSLEERRSEAAAGIDGRMMALYDELRGSRHGRAVAKVEGGACQGCRISLPVNLRNRARGGSEIVQCNNCERILYVI